MEKDIFPIKLSGKTGPLVSIIFPVYNVEDEYVRRALESVIKQTYGDIEVIVIDSSQKEWLANLGAKRDWINYNHQNPQGISIARNEGLRVAKGEIIAILDADDEYCPKKIEKQVNKIEEGVDMVYSDEYIVNEKGNITKLSSLGIKHESSPHIKFFRRGDGIPNLTVALRRSCFEKERFWEELQTREDPHLWVRILKKCEVGRIPEPLAYKHRRSDSLTSDPDMMYENEKKSIEDLVERFEELEEYKGERLRNARYRYGKQLFHAKRMAEARREFFSLLIGGFIDYRVVFMFLITLFPFGKEAMFHILQGLNEKIKRTFG